MTNQEKMSLLLSMYRILFATKAQNVDAPSMVVKNPYLEPLSVAVGRWFKNGLLRGFDFDVRVGDRVLQLRMVEQNFTLRDPAGNLTHYANLAVQGHSIVWVIDRKKKNDAFLGRIQDGKWHASKPRAVTNAAAVNAAYEHINRDVNDPNFHGIPGTSVQPAKNSALPHLVSEIPDIPGDIGIPDYVVTAMNEVEDPYELSEYA